MPRLLPRFFPKARHAAVATAAPQANSVEPLGAIRRELRALCRGAVSARLGVAKTRSAVGASAIGEVEAAVG